jgi:hypothetical protein
VQTSEVAKIASIGTVFDGLRLPTTIVCNYS